MINIYEHGQFNSFQDHLAIIAIFGCRTTLLAGYCLDYLNQDALVSQEIFLRNISLSSVSLLSLVSWFTRLAILSVPSWASRIAWFARCSFEIIARFSYRTTWSRSSWSSCITLSALVTLLSFWAISWAFLDEVISLISSFTGLSWFSGFTRFSIFTCWTWVSLITTFSLVTTRSPWTFWSRWTSWPLDKWTIPVGRFTQITTS